jgi:hypothetical protein
MNIMRGTKMILLARACLYGARESNTVLDAVPLYERMAPIIFNDRVVWFPGTGTAMTFTHDYSNTVAIVSISDFQCRNKITT